MVTKEQTSKAKPSQRTQFSVSETADALGTLLNRVAFGREQITITRGKSRTPIAKLVPVDAAP